jgi:glycine/D-amino acid oxidase-like deaminating enzyme
MALDIHLDVPSPHRSSPPTGGWDAIVVGAGISGLAAAYELARRDRRVLVLDAAGVGTGQSAGLGRIFRVAHGDPRLCALALEAAAGWRRWERELGAGRLLGEEGVVVAGAAAAERRGAAMAAAGAAAEWLDHAGIRALVPRLAPTHPWDEGLLDAAGGSLRVRRALHALAGMLDVRRGEAVAVEPAADGAVVRLADRTALTAGAVLICAGVATGPLAAQAGVEVEASYLHHVRLTYGPRPGAPPVDATACLITAESYGLPLGSTGRWALGLEDVAPGLAVDTVSADDVAAAVRRQHRAWVPGVLRDLDAEPLDEIRCVSVQAPWADRDADGFVAVRRGPIVAFAGSNVMKFGPLVGDRLARTVLDHEHDVHLDLQPQAVC